MDLLLNIHSILRWVVVVLAVAAILRFLVGWLRGLEFAALDRALMGAFAGMVDLNVTLGIIILLWLGFSTGAWPMYRLEHAGTMLVALAVVHGTARWRRRAEGVLLFRNSFLIVLVVTLLIVAGVASVGGWS